MIRIHNRRKRRLEQTNDLDSVITEDRDLRAAELKQLKIQNEIDSLISQLLKSETDEVRDEAVQRLRHLRQRYEVCFDRLNSEVSTKSIVAIQKRNGFETDVRMSIQSRFEVARKDALWTLDEFEIETLREQSRRTKQGLIEAQRGADLWEREFGNQVGRAFEQVVPHPDEIGMNPRDTRWYSVSGRIKNHIRSSIKSSYRNIRSDTKASLLAKSKATAAVCHREISDEIARATPMSEGIFRISEQATHRAGNDIAEALMRANERVQDSITQSVRFLSTLSTINTLFLLWICMRSYSIVFARVAFAPGNGVFVTVGDTSKPMPKGELKCVGAQYEFDVDSQATFFVAAKYRPSGHAPCFSIPQAFSGALARLLNRAWAMNRITIKDDSPTWLTTTTGAEYVEWRLSEGEKVIFNYANFVGMCASTTLSTTFDWRLSSLLMGRILFPTANGPGILILRTRGQPVAGDNERANTSVAIDQLVAWQMNTAFTVDSSLTWKDVLACDFHVKKEPGGLVVFDADSHRTSKTGLLRLIRYFLLPI